MHQQIYHRQQKIYKYFFFIIDNKIARSPIKIKIRGICIVNKSIIEIPTSAKVMVEKIMALKAGKFINDQTQGSGHNSSRK